MSTAKDELARLIQEQPEDSSHGEIVGELAFPIMVQRGLAEQTTFRPSITWTCKAAFVRGRNNSAGIATSIGRISACEV